MCSLKLKEEQYTYSLVSHLACQIISNNFPKVIWKNNPSNSSPSPSSPFLWFDCALRHTLWGGREMAVIVPWGPLGVTSPGNHTIFWTAQVNITREGGVDAWQEEQGVTPVAPSESLLILRKDKPVATEFRVGWVLV